jgi:hypothetical protein
MTYPDDMLMAYADGELDGRERAAIEEAMRADPAVAEAVARHQALRRDVFDAFAGILDEPVPQRLRPRAPNVVELGAARERGRRRLAWPEWGALAATLAVGVLAGGAGWHLLQADDAPVALAQGGVAAQGRLAEALSRELASAPRGDVRIGVSFVSGTGEYCRSFTMGATAGLACRSGDGWRIPVLAAGQAPADAEYRQAAAQLPQAVLDAIDERIAGEALDARGERAARDRGWRR